MIAALLLVVPASAWVDFECTGPDAAEVTDLGFVGLPPLTVECSAYLPAEGEWDQVRWTFGDGGSVVGDTASFTYDEVGQYTVSVQLDGYVDPVVADPETPRAVRPGFVTVCGPPAPEFTWSNKGGRRYALVNASEIAPFCLDTSRWEIYRGKVAEGEPAMVQDTWDTAIELPSDGPWTVRLTQNGLAGPGVVDHVIDVRYQLTDDLKSLGTYACSTTPGATVFGSALGLLFALSRRRRA